jgi:hypothetical protein
LGGTSCRADLGALPYSREGGQGSSIVGGGPTASRVISARPGCPPRAPHQQLSKRLQEKWHLASATCRFSKCQLVNCVCGSSGGGHPNRALAELPRTPLGKARQEVVEHLGLSGVRDLRVRPERRAARRPPGAPKSDRLWKESTSTRGSTHAHVSWHKAVKGRRAGAWESRVRGRVGRHGPNDNSNTFCVFRAGARHVGGFNFWVRLCGIRVGSIRGVVPSLGSGRVPASRPQRR